MSENNARKKRTTAKASEGKSTGRASASASSQRASGAKTRKSSSARGTGTRKPDKRTIDKKKSFIRSELAVILAAFLGLFLFLCNFNILGVVGDYVSAFEKGLFGMTAYALPVLILATLLIYVRENVGFLAKLKLISCISIILILSALMQLLFGGKELISAFDYYREGAAGVLGGGMVGGVLAGMLRGLTGDVGAYLILIALFIVCMVIVTEKSIINAARHGAEKTVDMAKEQHVRYREACEESKIRRRMKREEERLSRLEKDFPYINIENIQNEDADGQQRIDEAALSKAIAEQAKLYAEFGRDIIGPEQVDTSVVNMQVSEAQAEHDTGFDTTVISNVDTFTGTISVPKEYDYNVDEVPFDEDPHEKYVSYDYITEDRPQVIDLRTALESGYAGSVEQATVIGAGMAAAATSAHASELANEFMEQETEQTAVNEPSATSAFESATPSAPSAFASAAPSAPAMSVSEPSHEIHEEDDYSDCDITEQIYQTAQGKDMTAPSAYEADRILRDKTGAAGVRREADMPERKTPGEQKAENDRRDAEVAKEINTVKAAPKPYEFPPVQLLTKGSGNINTNQAELRETAIKLQQVLHTFGVGVTVTNVTRGPSVTRYEMAPDIGVKVSKITSLTDDIKLALAASDIRIEAPIPGKAAVGIEVPNKKNTMVHFRDIIETDEFKNAKSKLSFGIGKDIQGQVVVGNIAKMPHVLIAGATGSGKSVGINTLIMSLIYKAKPEEVRLIMIDPKVVELSVYNGIPHLLIPVVTDAKKAVSALNWAVAEMNDRYKKFAETGTRNLSGYNEKIEQISAKLPEEDRPKKLPQIVIIIDELAELMMTASKEVEADIVRLAQLARAAGMHLVIATQRPSVDVITGLIKANIPSRIAFKTSSGVDSRTILDMVGAETLLGNGDMLYAPADAKKPLRIQGAFVSDEEVEKVVDFLKKDGNVGYEENITRAIDEQSFGGGDGMPGAAANDRDEYFEAAGMLITEKGKASIGMLQRMFKIGFNRAARIMDQLYEAGVVGEDEGTKPRKVLMSAEEFKRLDEQG